MSRPEIIGIVGAGGDLGSRMTLQTCSAYEQVYAYDPSPMSGLIEVNGIDPEIRQSGVSVTPRFQTSVSAVLESCSVIHWCAPLSGLENVENLPPEAMLVLHDSVMNNSMSAREIVSTKPGVLGKITVAHCLMNPERIIVVASDVVDADELSAHIEKLGLNPYTMTAQEHDFMMAHTQAPLALLSLVLRERLHEYAAKGLLTKSANELMGALDARASQWTPETIHAILSNPELTKLISELGAALLENPEQLEGGAIDI